jgi:ribosomal protein L10
VTKETKMKDVESLAKIIEQYPVVGIIDMFKLPSRPMQNVKKKLKEEGQIKLTKKTILIRDHIG